MAEDTRVRYNLQQISTDCVRSRTISVISGPYLLFVGYLLQSLHRPAVIFHCVLHGSVVAKWSFQVSVFISVFFRGYKLCFYHYCKISCQIFRLL